MKKYNEICRFNIDDQIIIISKPFTKIRFKREGEKFDLLLDHPNFNMWYEWYYPEIDKYKEYYLKAWNEFQKYLFLLENIGDINEESDI